jgi:hypothetical protein
MALAVSLPALATLTYTCDSNIDLAQAGTCAALNGSSVAGVYGSIFSNVNANIYIEYGPVGIGASSFGLTSVTYAQFYTALAGSTDNATALASLPSGSDPLLALGNTNGNISVTSALASALNLTANGADTAGVQSDGVTGCTLGGAGCYNGVIAISNGGGFVFPANLTDPVSSLTLDFYSVVEHETDEVLGTLSCIASIGGAAVDQCGSTDASPADLFRYASAGTRTYLTTATGTPAYFSIDGGNTIIDTYINDVNIGDYGDWALSYPYRVQDGEASGGVNLDISTDGGSEVAALNAVGFSLAVPEPGTFGLLGVGLSLLAMARARRRS